MSRRRQPQAPHSVVTNADLQLTQVERDLILNLRGMENGYREFITGTAAHFVRVAPADRPRLVLVADGSKGGVA